MSWHACASDRVYQTLIILVTHHSNVLPSFEAIALKNGGHELAEK